MGLNIVCVYTCFDVDESSGMVYRLVNEPWCGVDVANA